MTHTPSPCSQQVRAGTQAGRNLEAGAAAKAVEDAAWQIASGGFWIASCGLLSFFSPISYNHIPMITVLTWAGSSHIKSPVKKMSHRLVYRLVLWKHFPYSDSLFPDDPVLCQDDIKASRK